MLRDSLALAIGVDYLNRRVLLKPAESASGALTRMACAPALMRQEDRFLNLLGRVVSAKIGRQGELLLSTPEDDTIRAFQSSQVSP